MTEEAYNGGGNRSSALAIVAPQASPQPEKIKNGKLEPREWVKLRTLARRDIRQLPFARSGSA